MVTKPNLLDRAINYLAPVYGLRRQAARAWQAEFARFAYDAGARGPRLGGWRAEGTDANAEIGPALHVVRARARELVRNNSYAAKAVGVLQRSIVGAGILPKIGDGGGRAEKRLRERWDGWGETTICDTNDRRNFYGLQAAAVRCMIESGEVLVRRRWRRPEDELPLPFQVQILEPDHLDTAKSERTEDGNLILQGVEFDRLGRRVAYWLFDSHPGGLEIRKDWHSKRVPAADILHVFRDDRLGQVRGISWGAATFVELRDYNEAKDARLIREKMAACLVAFVAGSVDSVPVRDGAGRPVAEKLVPGTIRRLGSGESVTFSNPGGVDGFRDFASLTLESISAGYEVPYELLTGDFSRFNYSSSRLSHLVFGGNLDDWQWNLFIPQFCDKLWGWVVEGAMLELVIDQPLGASWVPPRRPMIDPLKETLGEERQIRNGFKTVSQVIREAGGDPDQTWEERRRELARLRELGIPTDTDPGKAAAVMPAEE